MCPASNTARYRQQRGLGLVSLMIALVIGLFLLAGLFDRWYSMNRAFSAQNQLAQLQASERAAFIAIENTVQAAGYFPNYFNFPNSRPSGVPAPTTPITADSAFVAAGAFATGQYISGTHAASGDTLTVRFMAGEHSLDCQGQRPSAGALVTNTFSVSAAGALQCAVNGGTPVSLVDGVDAMSIVYGVDTNGDASADRYMDASAVSASSDWGNVRSAAITLTFSNPLYGSNGQTQKTLPPIQQVVALERLQ